MALRRLLLCKYRGGASAASYSAGIHADSEFSASVEVEQGRTLRLAVYQHLALVRRVYNLFEDDDVVGISNYVDLGVVMEAPLRTQAAHSDGADAPVADAACLRATASWQVCSCSPCTWIRIVGGGKLAQR